MLREATLPLLALALSACPSQPPAPPPAPSATAAAAAPTWKAKDFVKSQEGCTQLWSCDCAGQKPRTGCHLQGTRDDTTSGACAADSGPVNACTRCLALPPAKACACDDVCP
jgi:hypothetical protein